MKRIKIWTLLVFIISTCEISISQTGRLQWQPPEQIMDSLGVGDKGKVYANDINEYSLDVLRNKCKNEDVENIEIVVGETEDPLFPEKKYDMMIMVYVLHHLDKPVKFLKNLEKYMEPGIPMVVIEQRREHDRSHYHDFLSEDQINEIIKQTNFEMTKKYTFLQKDNLYIFELKN